jgi:quercetin dioxygenase-like cupin family protein
MKVTPRSEALTGLKPMDEGHFTGKASARDLMRASRIPLSAFAAVVRFEPGVRNNWHAHAGGQVLHVIEGEGWVQDRKGGAQRIRVGDTVTTDPNEEHWHGAGRNGPMAHLAIGMGDTRWLEESPAPPD